MVLVQYTLGALQVQVVFRIFVPGQRYHRLQVVHLDAVVGTLRVQHVQLVELFHEGALHLVAPQLLAGLLHQFQTLRRTFAAAQLFFQVLYLLLKEVLALLLVDVLARADADVLLQLGELHLAVHGLQRLHHPVQHTAAGEQVYLLLHAEGHVRTDEVQGYHIAGDVLQRKLGLVGDVFVLLHKLRATLTKGFHRGLELAVVLIGHYLADGGYHALQMGTGAHDRFQMAFRQTLKDHSHVLVVGHVEHTQYLGAYAVFVQVFLTGILYRGILLAEYCQYLVLIVLQMVLHQTETRRATYENGRHHAGKQDHVAGGKNGYDSCFTIIKQ